MLDWRKIEAALSDVMSSYHIQLDRMSQSGDVVTANAVHFHGGMDLTELAKDLVKELER